MSSKRSSSYSSADEPSAKKTNNSSSSGSDSDVGRVETETEPVFTESTFDEATRVFTYCGGWIAIDARTVNMVKSIIIEEGVTEIADCKHINGSYRGLFSCCFALTSITFPQSGSFVRIGSRALSGCSSLATVTVPDSCVEIAKLALFRCSSLKSFTFPSKCAKLNTNVLYGCKSLTTLNISDDCVELNDETLRHCRSLVTLAIPNACAQVNGYAFYGCDALKALATKANLTIEEYCRKQWQAPRLLIFKVNLFACYNVLNRIRVNDPLLNDPLIDKTSILWVLYDRITSDDVRRNIMEFLDYKWMGNK